MRLADITLRGAVVGIALISTAGHGAHGRQKPGERAHCGGFAGAAIAESENTADLGIDGRNHQSELHFVLADDRGKWEGHRHALKLLWPGFRDDFGCTLVEQLKPDRTTELARPMCRTVPRSLNEPIATFGEHRR